MKTLPSKSEFFSLRKQGYRVPVLIEGHFSNLDPSILFQSTYGQKSEAFLFESGNGPGDTARYSFWGESNGKSLSLKERQLEIRNNGSSQNASFHSLDQLKALEFDANAPTLSYLDHFWGGWVGYLGYEMGEWLEDLDLTTKSGPACPLFMFMQVEDLWVYDHRAQMLKLILSREYCGDQENEYESLIEEAALKWDAVQDILEASSSSIKENANMDGTGGADSQLISNLSLNEYMDIVGQAQKYIEEGDIYQANLAQRFEMDFDGDAFNLYERLRNVNPSPFSGYLRFEEFALASSSPERLVKVEGDHIETRPIAGTRPRGKSMNEDQALAQELLLNDKEKAEHLMLVDLERNDLGRVCETGSVQVTDLMFLEKYSHVIHIVSNIEGRLKPTANITDILKAVFPGGTITGCPKIRCMEIINELEPSPRGPYSGSFGYIGFSHYMDLNIIIRTILIQDGKASFHVGAGIVADSVAENEYRETLDKAAAMVNALTGETL